MIHPYDPQAAMNAKYEALARENAAQRASQAATGPRSTGCGSRAAHDPHGGAAGRTALRDRIRDALHSIAPDCVAYHPTDCAPCTQRADTLMRDHIQPELDRRDREIAERRRGAELADSITAKAKELLTRRTETLRRRAEAAEAALATQNAENDRLDQLLIDERATTARLGRELGRLRDQNGHHT